MKERSNTKRRQLSKCTLGRRNCTHSQCSGGLGAGIDPIDSPPIATVPLRGAYTPCAVLANRSQSNFYQVKRLFAVSREVGKLLLTELPGRPGFTFKCV